MTLSLRHIEIFHAVMSAGGATQAAALLRTSQPTVSRELKDLERLLGFPLFTRKGRRLLPTEAALALHGQVRRSFVGLQEIARAAEAIRGHASAHINVGCLPAYGTTLLPDVCREFLREHPSIRLGIHSFEQAAIANGLATRHYDLGIIEADPRLDRATALTVEVGEELCILPKDHPLARKTVLAPEDFEGADFIYFSVEDSYRRSLDNIFQAHGVTRRLRVEATTATSVCALVAQGLGVSIVNPISALYGQDQGIEVRKFAVSVPYRVGLYCPVEGERLALVQLFRDACAAALRRIGERAENLARLGNA